LDPKSDIHTISTKEIYASLPGFEKDGYKKFGDRLRRLKKTCSEDWGCTQIEESRFAIFKESAPKIPFPLGDKTDWSTHQAKQILESDIENELAYELKPKDLWEKREIYNNNFDLNTFRGHVNDLKSKKLAAPFWTAKRNGFVKENKWIEGVEVMKKTWKGTDHTDA